MPNKDKNIPKRRFKEFENADAWELRKLNNIADVRDGTHNSPRYIEFGYPLVTSKNIKNGQVNFEDIQYISSFDYEEINKRSKVNINDILMGMIGTVGNLALVREEPEFAIKNVALIKNIGVVNIGFLYHYLGSYVIERQLQNSLDGGTQKFISLNKIRHLDIAFPSHPEQEVIGTFFSTLDRQITLHQRKLDKLKSVKQAYLSEMFPAEGERVPKRRFPGFTDDWELRKLGEVAEIVMGQSPDSKNYTDNPLDNILVQGNADLRDGCVVPRVWTTQVTKTAEKGDLILSVRAPVGDVGRTNYNVVLGRGVAGIKGNEFIYHLLVKMKLFGYWTKLSTGSTFESINSDDIKNSIILFPSHPEQSGIGTFFSTLDRHITLHQRKLEKLKNLKKALLNELFV
ncbi:TPA: restriction endonuclease subunit S [Streptococcus suis]|nr:restriction endonuclease subunit S [Streptococcus suis]